ncbi:MAG: chromate efflux transporter [Elusimicrobia bacterium]|nr:chromate efflux transporter [Elusimicrobiota bacterium]
MSPPKYGLKDLGLYFLRLGATGFGGPVALIAYMHRDLVENRRWFSEDEYKEGITLANLTPGPVATQLGIFLGYAHHGVRGATIAGLCFVLPAFLIVVGLAWIYQSFGTLAWIQSAFRAVGAAIIGIVAFSAYRLLKKTIEPEPVQWAIVAVMAAATAWLKAESLALFLGCGLALMLAREPLWPGRRLACLNWPLLATLFLFFGKAGAMVFGSGLVIVPFLYGGVVAEHRWLTDQQFVDAVAVAVITPGPVVITVGFIGFLVSGLSGAVAATLGTFLPCYLFTLIGAPYLRRYGASPRIKAFVDGVTAAAMGALAGAVLLLARRTLPDATSVAFAAGALGLVMRQVPEPLIVLGAAALGAAFIR